MPSASATRFIAPAIPWLQPQPLLEQFNLGPGLDAVLLHQRLSLLAR